MKFEAYLDTYGELTYRFQGVSMMPMLRQGRDTFTVAKKTDTRCKKYDVALYRRGEQYVLHRVVKVTQDAYVFLGDNCLYKEYNIRDADILGLMVSFQRDSREFSATHWSHQLYARIWYFLYPLRFPVMWIRGKLWKMVKNFRANHKST